MFESFCTSHCSFSSYFGSLLFPELLQSLFFNHFYTFWTLRFWFIILINSLLFNKTFCSIRSSHSSLRSNFGSLLFPELLQSLFFCHLFTFWTLRFRLFISIHSFLFNMTFCSIRSPYNSFSSDSSSFLFPEFFQSFFFYHFYHLFTFWTLRTILYFFLLSFIYLKPFCSPYSSFGSNSGSLLLSELLQSLFFYHFYYFLALWTLRTILFFFL